MVRPLFSRKPSLYDCHPAGDGQCRIQRHAAGVILTARSTRTRRSRNLGFHRVNQESTRPSAATQPEPNPRAILPVPANSPAIGDLPDTINFVQNCDHHTVLLIRPERIASPEAVILNEAQRSEGSAVVLSPSSVATP
jgi:hypothetical protein